MIHHPLLAAAGGTLALVVAWIYARRQPYAFAYHCRRSRRAACPRRSHLSRLALCSQVPATVQDPHVPWAVTYSSPLAARWSGAPLGIPVHPVQAYVALAFFVISICLVFWLPNRRQHGDIAGLCLIAIGVVLFITEFWRDPIGRGAMLSGVLKGPQAVSRRPRAWQVRSCSLERNSQRIANAYSPAPELSSPAPKLKAMPWLNRVPIAVPPEAAGQRLDHFIASQLEGVSRSRVQLLLDQGDVLVNGAQAKSSLKLRGGEQIVDHRRAASRPAQGHSAGHPARCCVRRQALRRREQARRDDGPRRRRRNAMTRATATRLSTRLLYRFKALSPPAATFAQASCIVSTRTPAASSSSPKMMPPMQRSPNSSLRARSARPTSRSCRVQSNARRAPSPPLSAAIPSDGPA